MRILSHIAACLGALAIASSASAQAAPNPQATAALAMFDGFWSGPARMTGRDGRVTEFEQMERIGPMLGGEIRVMEGKGRTADGRAMFNAFTVFSATSDGAIEMRSHIPGNETSRTIELKPNGYVWRMRTPAGELVYDITIEEGVWRETGTMVLESGVRSPFFEMTLTRRKDTDWPAANPDFPTRD
jgi:hypothetical protein